MILFLAQARLTLFFTVDLKKLKMYIPPTYFSSQRNQYIIRFLYFVKWNENLKTKFVHSSLYYDLEVYIVCIQLINMSNFFLINDSSRLCVYTFSTYTYTYSFETRKFSSQILVEMRICSRLSFPCVCITVVVYCLLQG